MRPRQSLRNLVGQAGFLVGLFVGCIACCICQVAWSAESIATRPNIVLIVSDDQAWTDYGFMGHPQIKTPHLDRLAADSLTFRRGYVPSSLCCPSLATILTGRYPHEHKITSNDPPMLPGLSGKAFQESDAFRLGRERMNQHMQAVATLPGLLKEHGYLTLQTGKFWQGHYSHGGFTHGMTRGERHGDEGLQIGRKTLKPIEDFIDMASEHKRPWMVWYAPMLPHDPHNAPAKYLDRTKALTSSETVAKYWANVEWFDQTVGDLMGVLEAKGLSKDTLVVYVTDNGWIQDPEQSKYAAKSKQSPYEGGVRTPIMLRWPSKILAKESDDFAHSIDLMPTVLKAVGIEVPKDLPGLDLLDREATGSRKIVFGECFTHNAKDLDVPGENLRWRWAIQSNWKLIVPNPSIEKEGIVELYDLAADPQEEQNLATDYPKVVEELGTAIDNWWPACTPSR
ncbi:MAG: sulfatase-like hydrolase/transferase [Planctomycetota bacterium]|nr:sulfatase-like hydrolase/transferase [Planctomycetota bacterium]